MTTSYPLSQIAEKLSGTTIGNPSININSFSALNEYAPNSLSFYADKSVRLINQHVTEKNITALVISNEVDSNQLSKKCNYILVDNPRQCLPTLIKLFFQEKKPLPGIHPQAAIDPSVELGQNVSIGAFCAIAEGVTIEDDVIIHPHVTIYHGAKIGPRSCIHAGAVIREYCQVGADSVVQNGAVIGASGFGYTADSEGQLHAIPQVGIVRLADQVEVGANSCIDRAALGTTSLGAQTKVDNLVQIGHNVKVGQASILCGGVAIGGSSEIGSGVVMGGKAGVADHVTICSGTRLASSTGVISDIDKPGDYAGFPHKPAAEWRKEQVFLRKLMQWSKELRKLIKAQE